MRTKRPRLFPRRARKPPDHGELFKLAFEEEQIKEQLTRDKPPLKPPCLACSAPSIGLAIWTVERPPPGYDGPEEMAACLCQACHDRGESDDTFRGMIIGKMMDAWRDGRLVLAIRIGE